MPYIPFGYDEYALHPWLRETVPFYQEYFTGADINIYFQGVFIDEVTSLEFQLTQNFKPIYGYNSYVYDTLAAGQRIIQGSFTINFKETNYLEKKMSALYGNQPGATTPVYGNNILSIISQRPVLAAKYGVDEGITEYPPSLVMAIMDRSDPELNNLLDSYVSTYWGAVTNEQQYTQPFMPYRFDILVVFGQMEHRNNFVLSGKSVAAPSTENLAMAQLFLNNWGPRFLLQEVQIIGVGQQNSIESEANVVEVYNFVCRDIVKQPALSKDVNA
ncbi:hypothetical protein MTAT_20580 [Moorella thermoacetica]|uniref:Uncharacterized protein n=1 Tax=Neomoorella thermoacetica TaxID=1525 RepID=A0AAC9HIV7_NEOTH|nr:hypothetical protein [Moorella thermoacetica]AOQ24713.1 hypothetical protein Maut_02285 [Moorella thermoacetica]TYL12816.1 hypothetical protein MTAT_20580 [Moorella thermoacetica]